jgi:hypothetical protein
MADSSTSSANPSGVREIIRDEAGAFREQMTAYMEEYHIPPANVHIADETGMWNGSEVMGTV